MPSAVNYYYARISASVTIGKKEFSVSNFEISYELDDIAVARIDLPMGRQISGNAIGKVASSMGAFDSIDPFTPVELKMQVDVLDGRTAPPGKNKGFPLNSLFTIFKGYFSAPLHTKSMAGNASLTIQCFGETAALAGSTQYINGTSIIAVPNGSSYVTARLGKDSGVAVSLYDAVSLHCPNIADDLWGAGIKLVMQAAIGDVSAVTGAQPAGSVLAEAALARINKNGVLPQGQLTLTNNGTLGFKTEFQKALARCLTDGVYRVWRDGSDEADLWDVIRGLGQYFRFHFVPAVLEDALAPVCPNLGGEPFVEIDPSEYNALSASAVFSPKFYAYQTTVGVYTKAFSSSPFQATCATSRVIGLAVLKSFSGKTKMMEAPNWLIPPGAPAKRAFKPGGITADKASSTPDAAPSGLPQGQLETLYFNSGIGDNFAKAVLHDELFIHRKFSFTGRLRFDIAPGSLVKINTVGEAFTGEKETLYGMLDRIKISVNCGLSSHAKTEISLSHVRTESEHDKFTVSAHPLFNQRWVGGSLIEGAE